MKKPQFVPIFLQPDLKLLDSSGSQTFPEFVEVGQGQVVVEDLDPVDQEARLAPFPLFKRSLGSGGKFPDPVEIFIP